MLDEYLCRMSSKQYVSQTTAEFAYAVWPDLNIHECFLQYITCVFCHFWRGGNVLRLLITPLRTAGSRDTLVSQPVSELIWVVTPLINNVVETGEFSQFLAWSFWASGNEDCIINSHWLIFLCYSSLLYKTRLESAAMLNFALNLAT